MLGDGLRRVLRGQPSLRRQLRGLDDKRVGAAVQSLSDLDPKRWKSLYRDRLRQFVGHEQEVAPMLRKEQLEAAQQEARASGDTAAYNQLGTAIRETTPRWGSVEQRNDPRRWGSVASRNFRGLYRS